jgi:hypothetical protein
MTTITVRINASRYADSDDCLSDAARDYAATVAGLDGWDLAARWEDGQRETILLSVPEWATV